MDIAREKLGDRYKESIVFCLLEALVCLPISTTERNNAFQRIIHREEKYTEEERGFFCDTIEAEMEAIMPNKARLMVNRPNPKRLATECYMNSLAEHRKTGNNVVIGYELMMGSDWAVFSIHAFNEDKKTGEYYDTDTSITGVKKDIKRIVYPIMYHEEALKFVLNFEGFRKGKHPLRETLTETRGGYYFLLLEGSVYMIRTFGNAMECEGQRTRTYRFHKKISPPPKLESPTPLQPSTDIPCCKDESESNERTSHQQTQLGEQAV